MIKKLIRRITTPCRKCPYKLGLIHTLISPCPQCEKNGYPPFRWTRRGVVGDYGPDSEGREGSQ